MKNTHSLVAQTAREIAAEFYEVAARNNMFYDKWKSQRHFVKRTWQHFVTQAYDSLVKMLGEPDERVSPLLKEKVYEAVIGHRLMNPNNDPGSVGQIVQ
jgi:hypothetical protein